MQNVTHSELKIDPFLYKLFEFRPRKGDFKKIQIIKAAIECLATIGIENTTYEAIALKIGTRRAHVAYHFTDKNSIYDGAIKFILATYQKMSIELINKAKTPEEMLSKYIEAGFKWAVEFPNQASVILMFYYLSTLNGEYKELNTQVKKKGQERISFILKKYEHKKFTRTQLKTLSIIIQNLTSSSIQDCMTTNLTSFHDTKKRITKIVKNLVDNY